MAIIEITYAGADRSDPLDRKIEEQIESDLGKFGDRITRVIVHLADANAAKAGPRDKKCTLEARPASMEPIVVHTDGDDFWQVAKDASGKIERALRRKFEKTDSVT